ncbi:MAG: hypothetical protein H7Y38_02235 [Armatimonadetes bacterium]|nr:hypothetical protein [Armatimonadota bacterium]
MSEGEPSRPSEQTSPTAPRTQRPKADVLARFKGRQPSEIGDRIHTNIQAARVADRRQAITDDFDAE